jgi:hypothetical protein
MRHKPKFRARQKLRKLAEKRKLFTGYAAPIIRTGPTYFGIEPPKFYTGPAAHKSYPKSPEESARAFAKYGGGREKLIGGVKKLTDFERIHGPARVVRTQKNK